MKSSKALKPSLGDLDAEAATTLIATAADVVVVLDAAGVVRDLAFGAEDLAAAWPGDARGRRWVDTVTVESRTKVEDLLREASPAAATRWRHVNHPAARGADVPVMYAAVRAKHGGVVAVGRDLRGAAELQRRLVDAQQAMERDYARLRHAETRYRVLFRTTSEAVVVVDAATQKIVEANPAADSLFGEPGGRLVGRPFTEGFDTASVPAVQALLAAVRGAGRADELRARLADREVLVAASLFRQDAAALVLARLLPVGDAPAAPASGADARLLRVAENAPDGFVLTDADGRVLAANAAFLDLAQLPTPARAEGLSLEHWLGRPGVDLSVLIANLRQHNAVRLFATTLRGEYGATAEIEVSAVAIADEGPPCLGFVIRDVGRRLSVETSPRRELPRSVEQMTELVGRVPLKDLVRETTDVIERLCIEAALELTGDNRASAAEILGLSRQSLYVKLRRYGLADAVSEGEA